MSFREKNAWICLLTMAVVYGWYFCTALPVLAAGGSVPARHISGAVVILALLQALPLALVALRSPQESKAPADERERLIGLKGNRAGYAVLVGGALLCCVAGVYLGTGGALLANCIFLAVVLSQLAKLLTEIIHYRAGA